MTSSAFCNKDSFDRMIASFCDANSYVYRIDRDEDDLYRYTIKGKEPRMEYCHFIHRDAFTRVNLYLRFKEITEEVERRFDEITREKSRTKRIDKWSNSVYLETMRAIAEKTRELEFVDYRKMAKEEVFGGYCEADVKITKAMQKFFDPDKTPEIKDVIFKYPATIVFWKDGTKTVVQAREGDVYDPEKGLAMAICKKVGGNKWNYYNKFKHWLKKIKPESDDVETITYTTKVIKED